MWINISRRFTPSLWRVISRCGGKKKKHSLARTRSPINEHADFTAQKILKSSLPRCWPLSIAPVSDFISFQTCHTLNRATFCPQRSRDKIRKTTDEWIERSLPRLCLFVHEGRREKKEGKKIRDYKNSSRRGSLDSTTTRSIKRTILLMRILNATKKEKKRKGHWHFCRVKSVLIPIKNAMMDNLLARGDLSRFIFRENRRKINEDEKKMVGNLQLGLGERNGLGTASRLTRYPFLLDAVYLGYWILRQATRVVLGGPCAAEMLSGKGKTDTAKTVTEKGGR